MTYLVGWTRQAKLHIFIQKGFVIFLYISPNRRLHPCLFKRDLFVCVAIFLAHFLASCELNPLPSQSHPLLIFKGAFFWII